MSPCEDCGFDLWMPIAELKVSDLGLYSDSRFPGRSILRLRSHWESLEDIPDELLAEFLGDVRSAIAAIREATGAERVNFAILGNAVAHVHAHLIPRFPQDEPLPQNSPWDDPRAKAKLNPDESARLIGAIGDQLNLA